MIRNVVAGDGPAIQELNKSQLGYDYPVDKTINNLKRLISDERHHLLLVFEDENETVLGYVHAEIFSESYFDPMLNVLALAVSGSAQGQGIGHALMLELETRAKQLGLTEIRLNSGEERTAAHQFYEKLGYRCLKLQKRFVKKVI